MDKQRGVTFIELILVVTVVGFLTTVGWVTVGKNIGKGRDAQRRSDLDKLETYLEDYYNNKGCYPTAPEICCDAEGITDNPCHICGKMYAGTIGNPLPCDPEYPNWEDYLYHVEEGTDCPQHYRVYAKLSEPSVGSESENRLVCEDENCGACIGGDCGANGGYCCYSYGIASSNVMKESCPEGVVDQCTGQSFCEPQVTPSPTNTLVPAMTFFVGRVTAQLIIQSILVAFI